MATTLGEGGGAYSWDFLVGCATWFFKSWPDFRPKNVIFHTHFQTRTIKSIPIFRPGLYPEIMLSLIRLECKPKKNSSNPTGIRILFFLSYSFGIETISTFIHSLVPSKTIPDSKPKWAKCIPVFRPKQRKNPARWGSTYLYSLYKGVPTTGQQGCHYLQISHSNSPLITFTMFNYIHYVQEWLMKKVARWDYKGVSLSTDFLDKGH